LRLNDSEKKPEGEESFQKDGGERWAWQSRKTIETGPEGKEGPYRLLCGKERGRRTSKLFRMGRAEAEKTGKSTRSGLKEAKKEPS